MGQFWVLLAPQERLVATTDIKFGMEESTECRLFRAKILPIFEI